MLLGGKEFLQLHGATLAKIIVGMVGNVKEKGMTVVLNLVDLLVVVSATVVHW